jgi:acylphosphatase
VDSGPITHTTRLRAIITGEVQGVGYRAFARHYARRFGLTGYARNLADGSVVVIAEGYRDGLERLLSYLRRGPQMGHVEALTTQWEPATGEFDGFTVR